VADALRHRIRPVILDDPIVSRVRKRRLVGERKYECAGRVERLPEEALLEEVLRCAAVLCLDVRGPRQIGFEERGPALQLVELACADQVVDVFPRVRRELGVRYAELVPVDGREGEGGVVARKGEGRGVWVAFPG